MRIGTLFGFGLFYTNIFTLIRWLSDLFLGLSFWNNKKRERGHLAPLNIKSIIVILFKNYIVIVSPISGNNKVLFSRLNLSSATAVSIAITGKVL